MIRLTIRSGDDIRRTLTELGTTPKEVLAKTKELIKYQGEPKVP
jgi:hypothetical protein